MTAFAALAFEDWGIDVKISDVWIPLKEDVLQSPGPRWGRGVMDNGPLDRVGDAKSLTFYLKNHEGNSVGISGYYSPGHASALSGWTTGLYVRLWFKFEGRTFYKFFGVIEQNGIVPDAGLFTKRTARVSAQNFMAQAADHELNLLERALNKRIEEAVALIHANMLIQPLATEFATGEDTFPTVFDTSGSGARATSEYDYLAMSEFGMIYDKGDETGGETLVVESRQTRSNVGNTYLPKTAAESGHLLLEDGGYLLLEDGGHLVLSESQEAIFDNIFYPGAMRTSYGKHQVNRIRGITPIRRVDDAATTELYVLPSPIELSAGQELTVRGSYRDPAGGASYVNAVTDSMSDSYTANANEDGSGANLTGSLTVTPTYGTSEVSFILVASVAMWVTSLKAIGKGIYLYDPLSVIFEDVAVQAQGVKQITFDMRYQANPTNTEAFAEYTLGLDKDPHTTVDRAPMLANRNSLTMYGFLLLEPGTRAHFIEDQIGIDGDYFINGYEAEMFAGQYVIFSPVLKTAGASSFWIWDVSVWDEDTTWSFPEA
jgi:hypothetical protein